MSEYFSNFVSKFRNMIRRDAVETFNEEVKRSKLGFYNETEAKAAMTYNRTHKMLENSGPEVLVDTLNVESVLEALRECREQETCYLTDKQYSNVQRCINTRDFLMDKVDGIFVHDSSKGLVLIKKKEQDNGDVAPTCSIHV